jgi:hypothetical protein
MTIAIDTDSAAEIAYFEDFVALLERQIAGWEARAERQKNRPAVIAAHAWAVAPDYGSAGDGFAYGLRTREDRSLVRADESEDGGHFISLSLWRREDAERVADHMSKHSGQTHKIVHEKDIPALVLADKRKHLANFRAMLGRLHARAAKVVQS